MKQEPRRVGSIHLTFHIPENLAKLEERDREVLKRVGHNCPVMHSIHPDIEVKVDWGPWNS
jgi:hypothetical protein